jgi:hypothetical protein
MAIENNDIRKTGIWILLLAFIVAAIILPAANPAGTPAETFPLSISLIVISAFFPTAQQSVCAGFGSKFALAARQFADLHTPNRVSKCIRRSLFMNCADNESSSNIAVAPSSFSIFTHCLS